jgi:glucose/arabinose dehydrogenase
MLILMRYSIGYIRDVRQGPDGFLYVLTAENDGALMRIEPFTPPAQSAGR